MPITRDEIEGLTKQVFMVEYLLNGLFPCQSDVVRSIRSKKRAWDSNDKFEYRMLLAGTNTGGSLNSQTFKHNVGLIKPGTPEFGIFKATYGTVSDGFNIDLMANLETKEKRAAFENDYATNMHFLRMNVASMFKNFAIHGQFGVLHQLSAPYVDGAAFKGGSSPVHNDDAVHLENGIYMCPNTFTAASVGGLGAQRRPFRIKAPINVYNSNFKAGRYLIKTKEIAPWGTADVSEMYLILENSPGFLTLLAVGTTMSDWNEGEFLEITGNREVTVNSNIFQNSWSYGAITVPDGPFAGKYDMFNYNGNDTYTANSDAVVGAMEGLADLFPWYSNPTEVNAGRESRLGLDRPFRDQPNRLRHSTEMAGGFIMQQPGEHIIDAIMRGVVLTKSTISYTEIGMWMNPITRQEMGYEEGSKISVIRDNLVAGPIVYQRGIKQTTYQVGNSQIEEVIEDLNMPTDVIVIGPKNDISYNCWDNSVFEIDKYIQETWSKSKPPAIQDLSIPSEVITKLDLSKRITYGSPELSDGGMASFTTGNNIRHPKNLMPVAMHEMGALFTEYPYTYTVVKLRHPIFDITTT